MSYYIPDGKIEKKRRAVKDYKCDCCKGVINKNDYYIFGSTRSARYNDNDTQIGVQFVSWRLHLDPELCDKN